MRAGRRDSMRQDVRHLRFENGGSLMCGFPDQPKNQDGENYDTEQEAEQDQCRQ